MKKRNIFFHGCLLLILAASFIWIGCPDIVNPLKPGTSELPDLSGLGGPLPEIIPGDRQLTVSWNAVEGAAKYELRYRDNDTEVDEAEIIAVTGTSTVISNLENGTQYWVRIRAGNSKGWTGYGLELSGTPVPPNIPFSERTVENLLVTEEIASLTLTWSPVPGANAYKVEWFANSVSIGSRDVIVSELVDSNKPTITINNLSPGVEYTIEVSATNADVFTAAASTTGTPLAPQSVPSAPSIEGVRDGTSLGQFIVRWDSSATAADYKLHYDTANTLPAQLGDETGIGNVLTYTVTDGNYSTTYYVWVAAKNDVGWSPWSEVAEFTTRGPVVPAVPTGLAATPSDTIVHLEWNSTVNADKYEVAYSSNNFNSQTVLPADREGLSVGNLTNGTAYGFKVRAGSADAVHGETHTLGWSAWTAAITAAPEDWTTPPTEVPVVSFHAAGRKELNVHWTTPPGADKFKVKYGESSDENNAVLWKNGTGNDWPNPPVTITGLKDSTTYYVWVAAGNKWGYGNWSLPGTGTTLTPVTPAVPTGLAVTVPVPAQIHHLAVSWDAVGNAAKYELRVSLSGSAVQTIAIPGPAHPTPVTSVLVADLSTGSQYSFAVRAGADEWSNWSAAVTGTPILPKPASLSLAHNNVSRQLTAAWPSVSGADSYNVRYSTSNDVNGVANVSGSPASPYTIPGLKDSTTYYVWVRAQEGSGASAQYSDWTSASASTKAPELPANIGEITLTPGDGNIVVNWNAVSGATAYEVNYGATGVWTTTADTENTTYTISNLSNYTEYNVRVRAANADGPSNWSAVKTATPKLPLPPVPTGLTLDASARNSLGVSWNTVTQAGTAITYRVAFGKTDVESSATVYGDNIPLTQAYLSDLDGDTVYYVWVNARNLTGHGPSVRASAKVISVPPPQTAGGPTERTSPVAQVGYEVGGTADDGSDYGNTALKTWLAADRTDAAKKATGLMSGVIAAEWKAIEGASDYDIYVASSAKASPVPEIPAAPVASTNRLSYFVRDCVPDRYYFIWVAGKNANGVGPMSNPPLVGRVESARNSVQTTGTWNASTHYERANYVKNLKARVVADGSVRLTWDSSDRATWYEVYYSSTSADVRPLTGSTQSSAQNPSTNPSSGREMHSEMWAEGNSSQGNRRLVPYQWLPPLTSPTDGSALAIPWNDKTGTAGTPGEIFKVHSLETTITGLDPNTRYFFVVRSLNQNGERGTHRIPNGGQNIGVQGTMGEGTGMYPSLSAGGGLAAPTNVQANPVSPGGGGMLRVTWSAVPGATGYKVYFSKYPVSSTNLPNVTVSGGATTTADLIRLDENFMYYVWAVATTSSATSPFSEMASGVPNYRDGTESVSVAKTATWGAPLKNSLYIEVNDNDPRVALGYVLDDDSYTQFFDNVVIFSANFRLRNCGTEGATHHRCTKNGPHLHYNGNVQHILENRDKYIKPLQDAGIKVLLGTLGDHDHLIYWMFGPWPFEGSYPWNTANNPGKAFHQNWWQGDRNVYPLSEESVINAFIEELCSEIEKYGLDGFDMDDEWASGQASNPHFSTKGISTRPNAYTLNDTVRRQISQNINNFIYRARVRFDANTPAGAPKKIISVYNYGEINAYLGQSGATFGPGTIPSMSGTETWSPNPNIWNYADYSLYPYYGSVGNGVAGIPNAQYGYAANGFHNNTTASRSAYTEANSYGYVCWYGITTQAAKGSQQLTQINIWSQHCFGKNVIYRGQDYPQDWSRW